MSEADYLDDGADYLEEGCQRQTCKGCLNYDYCFERKERKSE